MSISLLTYRRMILSELNTGDLSWIELNNLVNDGYKNVCGKALCYESRIDKPNISSSLKLISLVGLNIIKVNYIEYYTASLGAQKASPSTIGHIYVDVEPLYWFQWGDYLYVEPAPDVSTYDLYLYSSIYPATVLSLDTDTPSIPESFHEDILNFALAFACLKLKRWTDFASYYNRYITSIQIKRAAYIDKIVDPKSAREPVDNVFMVTPDGQA